MNVEPVENNPYEPLISIFICNYEGEYLRECLDGIFQQNVLRNFEIILVDDCSNDGAWEIALEYQRRYPSLMTVQRNRKLLGAKENFKRCRKMARGRYCARLTNCQAFLPEYVKNCVRIMKADPHAKFTQVYPVERLNPPEGDLQNRPLVSILCYNYNYGRYLRECLESIFAQTYSNIEVCFSDNASTDESWEIALEFARKYPTKMHVVRNRKNFGPDANFANSKRMVMGKYYVNFCSDDALAPTFVEQCVNVLEANPNVGFAMVNRAIIDEHSRRTEEPPFYNQSCIIPGEEQAAVYMMAGVNPSVSQIMYRRELTDKRSATGALVSRYYGTRILDFNITLDYDMAFIKEPLLMHRIHSQSDTSQADGNLMPVLGLYVLNHQLAELAAVRNMTKVTGRLPQSLAKLARLGIRYSVRSLLAGNEMVAQRYFHMALAIDPSLAGDPTSLKLQEYWAAVPELRAEILDGFKSTENLAARSISYDPPPGSIPIGADGRMIPAGGKAAEAA